MFSVVLNEEMDFINWSLWVFYYLTIFVFSCPIILWLYKELTMGICQSRSSMEGKVVLITGGSNGIGFETAVDLAKRGAQLIIGCRKTQGVDKKIQQEAPGAIVDVIQLDLSSNSSIREFSEKVLAKYDSIDVLINNAGIVNAVDGPVARKETEDGFELVMATNYLGHSLLNHLLLDTIKKSGNNSDSFSRIILVSSIAVVGPEALDLCALEDKGSYKVNFDLDGNENDSRRQYSKTKLAQVMYMKHLSRKLKKDNCNTIVTALHPGFVRTDILDGFPKKAQNFVKFLGYLTGKTPLQGAQTTIHLAVSSFNNALDTINGKLFSDCRQNFWWQSKIPKIVEDEMACKMVWDETMRVLGLHS